MITILSAAVLYPTWLGLFATSQKVTGQIPDEITEYFSIDPVIPAVEAHGNVRQFTTQAVFNILCSRTPRCNISLELCTPRIVGI
jgi:hypothetical protein